MFIEIEDPNSDTLEYISVKLYMNRWEEIYFDEDEHYSRHVDIIKNHIRDNRQELEVQMFKYLEAQAKLMADDH